MKCCVKSCKSESSTHEKGSQVITFHRFPSVKLLRQKWIQEIQRDGWKPSKLTRICSLHFDSHDFLKTGINKIELKISAVPCLKSTSQPMRNSHDLSSASNDSPRVEMLKKHIILLRKKSKADGIKIKSLQNQIRRIQQRKSGNNEAPENHGRDLKTRRINYSSLDLSITRATSSDSEESLDEHIVDKIDFDTHKELEVKVQPIDFDDDAGPVVSSLDELQREEDITAIKLEVEDPLLTSAGCNY